MIKTHFHRNWAKVPFGHFSKGAGRLATSSGRLPRVAFAICNPSGKTPRCEKLQKTPMVCFKILAGLEVHKGAGPGYLTSKPRFRKNCWQPLLADPRVPPSHFATPLGEFRGAKNYAKRLWFGSKSSPGLGVHNGANPGYLSPKPRFGIPWNP